MAFTPFHIQPTGSNLNAGSTLDNAAPISYAGGNFVQSTGVYTVPSGNPVSDGVVVGDFVSIYADGASVTGFVGRVTARDATTITVSLTAKMGTAPTDGTGNRSLKVGGAWAGPNGTDSFPYGVIQGTVKNASSNPPKVYVKAATYNITAAMTVSSDTGPIKFEPYTTTPGDRLGYAKIDGGTSGASYILLSITGRNIDHERMEFCNNGATGNATGVFMNGNENLMKKSVFHDIRGIGFRCNTVITSLGNESYACNQSNSTSMGGMQFLASGTVVIDCISHHNTGSNASGFFFDQSMLVQGCVAYENGNDGASTGGDVNQTWMGCEFYSNGRDGLNILSSGSQLINVINCNFLANARWGISSDGPEKNGTIENCGFGSGTMANGSGDINRAAFQGFDEINNVTYAANVTPWVDPDNGDFTLTLAASKGTGVSYYTQTQAGQSGTVGYRDIGSAQHADSGGGQRSSTF